MSSSRSIDLDDESLAALLDEVAAMAASGRSIGFGLTRLENRSLGSLGRAALQIRKRLDAGESAEEAISAVTSNYRAPVRSAIGLLGRTGSPDAIIETGRLIRESARDRQRARITFLGSFLHLLLAITVFFAVLPWLVVTLSETDWELGTSSRVVALCRVLSRDLPLTVSLIAISVVAIFLVWLALQRVFPPGRDRVSASLCRWLAVQLQATPSSAGADVALLVDSAAAAAGVGDDWKPVVDAIQAGATSTDRMSFPESVPETLGEVVTKLVAGQSTGREAARDLTCLAALFQRRYSTKNEVWTHGIPKLLTFAVMLFLILTLAFVIVRPLGSAFEQLAR